MTSGSDRTPNRRSPPAIITLVGLLGAGIAFALTDGLGVAGTVLLLVSAAAAVVAVALLVGRGRVPRQLSFVEIVVALPYAFGVGLLFEGRAWGPSFLFYFAAMLGCRVLVPDAWLRHDASSRDGP